MQMMEQALAMSQNQTRVATEVGRAMTACATAMFDASMTFAKTSGEHQRALATALLSAKTPESAADLHMTFVHDAFHSAGVLATRMAEAFAVAAKTCAAEAARAPVGKSDKTAS